MEVKKQQTLLQDGAISVHRLVDDSLSICCLSDLLALNTDLLSLFNEQISHELSNNLLHVTVSLNKSKGNLILYQHQYANVSLAQTECECCIHLL